MYLPMLTNEELVCYMSTLNDLSAGEQELLSRLKNFHTIEDRLEEDIEELLSRMEDMEEEIDELTSEIEKLTEELGNREG